MISKLFGFSTDTHHNRQLPARIVKAIDDQEDASECLIGWVQIAWVCLFGFLYAVSPKTFSADTTFAIVPWVLSIYLLATVARLILAYRRRLTRPLVYLSVVVDMSLLLGMIWAFHVQYEQPPSFYLKSPTLLYVFVVIALRALRFEARYVMTAGIVAAVGWSALAVYATFASGGLEMVTRDYVYYMTSNSILIGAEFDKVITILTVTAIMAVAIRRAHSLLIIAVAEGAAARELSRFFSPEIADRITGAEQEATVGKGEARDAAILMLDIRGFTSLAAVIQPTELLELLAEYQARMVPIIQRHGGSIDKFLGDGIMATFGAAVPSASYAADALRAVDETMKAADDWAAEHQARGKPVLNIGAAVAIGRIIFGTVGDPTRMEYTVIGNAVNLSAKLEKHTKSEDVRALCTAAAYDTALEQGYRPSKEPERRFNRSIEGVGSLYDIVVMAP